MYVKVPGTSFLKDQWLFSPLPKCSCHVFSILINFKWFPFFYKTKIQLLICPPQYHPSYFPSFHFPKSASPSSSSMPMLIFPLYMTFPLLPTVKTYLSFKKQHKCHLRQKVWFWYSNMCSGGLPWWSSDSESSLQCRRHEFDPWLEN